MRENEPVLLILCVCDGEIILEKGEILSEKRQCSSPHFRQWLLTHLFSWATRSRGAGRGAHAQRPEGVGQHLACVFRWGHSGRRGPNCG